MPELIIIDRSEVRVGKLAELKQAISVLVGVVRANEPRIVAYNMYFNADGSLFTVVQVHPDSASAEFHMGVARAAFSGFVGLITMAGIDIYGEPSDQLLDGLRHKARMLGSGEVRVHELHAGFSKFASPAEMPTVKQR